MKLPDPVVYAIPLFVLAIVIEMLLVRRRKTGRYDWRDAAASLTLGLGSTVAGLLSGGAIIAIMLWASRFAVLEIPFAWWAFILCFVLDDLAYYVFHRSAHRIRWFWASHVIHHSSQHYNLSTALRQTWTGFFSASFIFRLPLILLGFPVEMLLFVAGLNLIYQFWIHTEQVDRMPRWFEGVMNTPSHHRVHHATNPRYLDRNYAGVFIIWDRMFGTFEPELGAERPRYGIVKNLPVLNPLWAAFHEWVAIARDLGGAQSLRDAAGYTLGPPGWRPDGGQETADAIRARWSAEHAELKT